MSGICDADIVPDTVILSRSTECSTTRTGQRSRALLDDGLFDVVAVGDLSALSVLANSYRVYLGTHLGMQKVHHARARRVSARPTAGEIVKLEIDGELAGRLPATFEILPSALRVRCP